MLDHTGERAELVGGHHPLDLRDLHGPGQRLANLRKAGLVVVGRKDRDGVVHRRDRLRQVRDLGLVRRVLRRPHVGDLGDGRPGLGRESSAKIK